MRPWAMSGQTMSFTIRTASDTALAWKPIVAILSTSASTVKGLFVYLLNSIPFTTRALGEMGADGLRTASVALSGADKPSSVASTISEILGESAVS